MHNERFISDCTTIIRLELHQCCQKVSAENPHYLSKIPTCPHQIFLPKIPTLCKNFPTFFKKPNKFWKKSQHFAKISPHFSNNPTIFEKNLNNFWKRLSYFKNFNPHFKKMVPTKPLKIPTVGINPHFRQHWVT